MFKTLVSVVALFAFASVANASGFSVFDSIEQCEIARVAGKAKTYTPSTKAPFQGGKGWTKKVVPSGGACLGQAHVLEDGAPKNGKAVYVEEGFVYWEHTSGAFRMNDCSNPFGSLMLASKPQSQTTQPASTATTCTTDDCGNTTKVVEHRTIINEVVEVRQQCMANGQEIALTSGQCIAPQILATLPVKVESATQGSCGAACEPAMALKVTNKVARTDGRCVLKVTDQENQIRFVRFGLQDSGHISAVRVTDEGGSTLMKEFSSMVGDGQSTAQISNKDCDLAIKAFSTPRALNWTAPRLGFKKCVVVGRV